MRKNSRINKKIKKLTYVSFSLPKGGERSGTKGNEREERRTIKNKVACRNAETVSAFGIVSGIPVIEYVRNAPKGLKTKKNKNKINNSYL